VQLEEAKPNSQPKFAGHDESCKPALHNQSRVWPIWPTLSNASCNLGGSRANAEKRNVRSLLYNLRELNHYWKCEVINAEPSPESRE